MQKKMKSKIQITTKTGDSGMSGLANGQRVSKASSFFTVIGNLDELNSWLGLLVAQIGHEFPELREQLLSVQDTLFYVGAQVALSPKAKLTEEKIEQLEDWQASMEAELEPNWHTKFVLPGGTILGAYADLARTVCRRTETSLVAHAQNHPVPPALFGYLNRLSDYLYLLRCYLNQQLHYKEKLFEVR